MCCLECVELFELIYVLTSWEEGLIGTYGIQGENSSSIKYTTLSLLHFCLHGVCSQLIIICVCTSTFNSLLTLHQFASLSQPILFYQQCRVEGVTIQTVNQVSLNTVRYYAFNYRTGFKARYMDKTKGYIQGLLIIILCCFNIYQVFFCVHVCVHNNNIIIIYN